MSGEECEDAACLFQESAKLRVCMLRAQHEELSWRERTGGGRPELGYGRKGAGGTLWLGPSAGAPAYPPSRTQRVPKLSRVQGDASHPQKWRGVSALGPVLTRAWHAGVRSSHQQGLREEAAATAGHVCPGRRWRSGGRLQESSPLLSGTLDLLWQDEEREAEATKEINVFVSECRQEPGL